jgi:hypothetical protein
MGLTAITRKTLEQTELRVDFMCKLPFDYVDRKINIKINLSRAIRAILWDAPYRGKEIKRAKK